MKAERHHARTLMGIQTRACNAAPQPIGELWQRFLVEELAEEIASRADDKLIAVYCDYEGDHTQPYTFFLGCEVIDVACCPDGYVLREIPVGDFVEFPSRGKMPRALMDTWQEIWGSNLKRSFIADFEVHDPATPDEVSVYVGVLGES